MTRIRDLHPLTLWHLRQAGECDRLATEREKLGDAKGANFWRRIYQEKMGTHGNRGRWNPGHREWLAHPDFRLCVLSRVGVGK